MEDRYFGHGSEVLVRNPRGPRHSSVRSVEAVLPEGITLFTDGTFIETDVITPLSASSWEALQPTKWVEAEKSALAEGAQHVCEWLEACTSQEALETVRFSKCYCAYHKWMATKGPEPVSKKLFAEFLRSAGVGIRYISGDLYLIGRCLR